MTEKFAPGRDVQPIKNRKERFAEMVAFVTDRGGWVTSTAGASAVTIDVLPGSTLSDELADAGYKVEEIGEGERILSHAITEAVIIGGASRPVMVTHAGITRVLRFSLEI